MKRRSACSFLVMCLGVGATSQPARDLPPSYACGRASATIAIDGKLDDAAWSNAAWTEEFIDIVGSNGKPPPAFRTRAKLLCDDAHLYIAAELVEPRVAATIRERDARLYKGQAFEVFIDPGADGRDYLELQVNPLNTVCDLAMTKPYRDRGQANIGFDLLGFRSAVSVDGTANDASDEDRSWTVEMAIPWAALRVLSDDTVAPPADGQRWRVNLARMRPADVDPGAGGERPRRDLWVWSAQGAFNMHLPERWGWVEFSATKRVAKP